MPFQETVMVNGTKLVFAIILRKKQRLIRYSTILVAKCVVDALKIQTITVILQNCHNFKVNFWHKAVFVRKVEIST